MRPKTIKKTFFRGYGIQVGENGNRKEVLDAVIDILEYMWNHCGKRLYICHFVLKGPDSEHHALTEALRSFRRTKLNQKITTEYIWSREVGEKNSNFPHCHLMIITDGAKIQSYYKIHEHLCQLMTKRLGYEFKKLHVCKPQSDSYGYGKKVTAKLDNLADAVHWLSYLTKLGNEKLPGQKKSYSYSKGYQTWSKATINTEKGV
jgi:hypothetical protein